MKPLGKKAIGNRRRGQTLAMALILMGVLLVLGVVFLAMINRNIHNAGRSQQRTVAYDLAEAGIRYVHDQMLTSVQGADWRPTLAPLADANRLDDPDHAFLRPPNPADPADLGGPDKLGAYSRLLFDRGRALVRVRYAPSDPAVFSSVPVGDFLQPGLARNYTIVEAVGRAGTLRLNDPTTRSLASGQSVETSEQTKLVGVIACGLTEQARFVANKFHQTIGVDLGFPGNLGVDYNDAGGGPTPVSAPVLVGTAGPMYNPNDPRDIPYGGSIRVNGDLVIHGHVIANLNRQLGDSIQVAGMIKGADDSSMLTMQVSQPGGANWTTTTTNITNNTSPSLDSDSSNFDTFGNLLRDSSSNGDRNGYPRGVPWLEAPSTEAVDPDTGVNRYIQSTRNSGKFYGGSNSGFWGFGKGVYVNNSADVQISTTEQGREDVGSAESLVYDWLNPNNGQANSGWQGAFYVPRGAYLRLMNDGWAIIRDGRAPGNQRTWREPDGSPSKRPGAQMTSGNASDIVASPYIRYRLFRDGFVTWVVNSYSVDPNSGAVVDLNSLNATTDMGLIRRAGEQFNGVIYFAGNVRVRGEIPTDTQVTIVSGATIYIEGSITKGVVNYGTRAGTIGQRISTQSKSMLALLAKNYVAVNTSQFFGTGAQTQLEEVKESGGNYEWNPILVRTGGSIGFGAEMLLDPKAATTNPLDPRSWLPYATTYQQANSNAFEISKLLVAHTMADGPAPATFINMDVNYGLPTPTYLWPTRASGNVDFPNQTFDISSSNTASSFYPDNYVYPGYTVQNEAPLYGLGAQSWQRYAKFESIAFPLVSTDFNFDPATLNITGTAASKTGKYTLLADNLNTFDMAQRDSLGGTPTNDYMIARAAIVPQDIRIEATIYAEEGSFFVIPGPWFNPNPNDRRDTYETLGTTKAERDAARLAAYGATPDMPFYGEPIDVRVQVVGSVTENMPPPIGQQGEWLKKWGWIPRVHGATGQLIPGQHVPAGFNVSTDMYVPNLLISYDPALATDRNAGFVGVGGAGVDLNTLIRFQPVDVDGDGNADIYYPLPPMPRLPVSPTLAYFGEVNP